MVKDWTNFLDVSGGTARTPLIDGLPSLAIAFGAPMLAGPLFNSLQKSDLRTAVSKRESLLDRISNNPRYGPSARIQRSMQVREKTIGNIRGIKRNYGRLIGGVKAIGWGYAAITMAQMVESMVTPGLSKSAEMNNNNQMSAEPMDSGMAYTQRQRALMAMHDSQLTIRGVLGQEANFFHR